MIMVVAAQTLAGLRGKVLLTGVSNTNVGWFTRESVLNWR